LALTEHTPFEPRLIMMLECRESSPLQDEDSFLNLLKLYLLMLALLMHLNHETKQLNLILQQKVRKVSWSLTSLFSINTAISETKGDFTANLTGTGNRSE